MSYQLISTLTLVSMLAISMPLKAGQCPEYLNQHIQKLHSAKTLNICEAYAGKPLLIVNTASHCGFTPQFSGLEKLYKQYKDKGLVVLGFASNDFNQEAKDEQEISNVCFINYGVTFDMFAPIKVTGESAHPLFKALAAQTREPAWNFNKYLVNADGKVVQYFDSQVTPNSPAMKQAIEQLLAH
ncbi:glutathione peroxidase [Methyloglobulus sp.]|uniref:glutathione peroxidase n=1 Tax=Methyloglobulus sp. TaxID=2518622 RepID=UPI0032B7AA18